MLTTTVAGRTWSFSHAIGRNAVVGAGFTQPTDVAVAPGDVLYVLSRGTGANPESSRVGRVTVDEEFLGDFGQGDFTWPVGLALDKSGNVYSSDESKNIIVIYDAGGQQLGHWGEAGVEDGQLNGPSGLVFDSEDNLYVVDSFNDRVQKFTKDGHFLMSWGNSGSGDGQLNRPWGITIDRNDDVYVADFGNHHVQKFSPEGRFLMSFGSSTIADGGDLKHPSDVAVDSEGDVYVTDWGNMRVQIYDSEGDILTALWGDAMEFSKWQQAVVDANPDVVEAYRRVDDLRPKARFDRPRGIAIDGQDRIFITDNNRGRVQVYAKLKGYMEPQVNL